MTEKYKLQPEDLKSMDIAQNTVNKLKAILPEVFTEGVEGNCSIDIEKLKIALGGDVNVEADKATRYSFNWSGKKQAQAEANKPSMATLRPCVEDSKNWDSTNNVYIEGDNLEVLKLLQKSYYGQIKMIYIDPPYNTGQDFVYKDNYHDNIKNYLELTGQIDDNGNKIGTNTESNGRYHTDWLNMMYPRLKLARNLLQDDGVIFISIDDNEVHNLRKVCDEIFGEDNFIGNIAWESKTKSQNTETAYNKLQPKIEHIILYTKNNMRRFNLIIKGEKEYLEKDEKGYYREYLLEVMNSEGLRGRETMIYEIDGISPPIGNQWKLGQDTINQFKNRGDLFLRNGSIILKMRSFDESQEINDPFWGFFSKEIGTAETAKKELYYLIGKHGFDTVKPLELIKRIIFHSSISDAIILDFFSGSATTAHAVMQLNAEDGGSRKYICVQLPEPTPEDSEAKKAGYKNICEIGKERIRRAGDKVLSEWQDRNKSNDLLENKNQTIAPDIGFKVFKLDLSNVKPFDSNDMFADDLLVAGRSALDLFYELVLKQGYSLNYHQTILDIGGTKCYALIHTDGKPFVLAVLDDNVKANFATQILKYALMLLIVKDDCFSSDEVKLNTLATLEQLQNKDNPLQIRIV